MMQRRLLSALLILSLVMATAICSYAANGGPKNQNGGNSETKIEKEQNQTDPAEKPGKDKPNVQLRFETKKEYIAQKKQQIRSEYSTDELALLSAATEAIEEEDPDAKVLGYDSVISSKAKFKFDTPPVIKGGRTLIPVRAITEGFGAALSYDQESQTVTITKGETTIELTLGSTTAIVNGEEVIMDTKAGITNNRTYVPLRFIMETLKLNVEWDEETETIEIDDDADSDETTTDGAISTDETTTDDAISTDASV
jgi:hypothetical protein